MQLMMLLKIRNTMTLITCNSPFKHLQLTFTIDLRCGLLLLRLGCLLRNDIVLMAQAKSIYDRLDDKPKAAIFGYNNDHQNTSQHRFPFSKEHHCPTNVLYINPL
jgi:hypothetical protein